MAADEMPVLKPIELSQKYFDDMWPFWKVKFEATEELKRFLAGERYVSDQGQFNRDRRGVQIRGQEVPDAINHVVAKATERPRSIEAKPKDQQGDPDAAEAMIALINDELDNPGKGFERERYMAMQAACEGRRGVVWMDWCPDHGAYGELFWSFQPDGSVMWDPAYHPHHPLCEVLTRHKRIDYRQANRDYGVDWLRPDHAALMPHSSNWKAGVPLMAGFSDRIAEQARRDDKVTIREVWIKNDPTEKPGTETTRTRILKSHERYMSCKSNCGYRSDTQAVLKRQGVLPKGGLPMDIAAATHPNDPSGCPQCGGALTRIDATDMTQSQLMYARGRRMICSAPFCPGPDGAEELYDGAWPIPSLRSFPGLFLFYKVRPGDNSGGPSLVDAQLPRLVPVLQGAARR